MRRFIGLVMAFALVLSAWGNLVNSGALAAEPHNSELWHIARITDPANKKFTYCAAESSFDNGFSLAFARNRELNTNIVVTFPRAALQEHTKFRMSLVIDGAAPREFVGFSANPQTLVIPLQHDRPIVDSLQKGKLLELRGPQDAIKFALDGANDALRRLQLCVETNLKAEAAGAGGTPEARPLVLGGPAAVDEAPKEDLVEPLPLPTATPPTMEMAQADQAKPVMEQSPARQPAPPIAPPAPSGQISPDEAKLPLDAPPQQKPAQDTGADAAKAAAAKEAAARDQQAQLDAQRQATDEAAAKEALAKLEAAEAAKKAAAGQAAQDAAAQQKAAQEAQAAEAVKQAAAQQAAEEAAMRQKVTQDAAAQAAKQAAARQAAEQAAAKQKAEQDAQAAATVKAEAAKEEAARAEAAREEQARQQAQLDAQRQAADDAAAKEALAKLEAAEAAKRAAAEQAAQQRAAADQAVQQAAQQKVAQDAAIAEAARKAAAEQAAQQAAASEEAARAQQAQLDAQRLAAARVAQPSAPSQPLAQASPPAVRAVSLGTLLQGAGVQPNAVKGHADAYSWKNGTITGSASEIPARQLFLDAMLDNIDALEKTCKGQFSSSIGAPITRGGTIYAEVATKCGPVPAVRLYYEKTGHFGVIAQESAEIDRDNAVTIRQRAESALTQATNNQ